MPKQRQDRKPSPQHQWNLTLAEEGKFDTFARSERRPGSFPTAIYRGLLSIPLSRGPYNSSNRCQKELFEQKPILQPRVPGMVSATGQGACFPHPAFEADRCGAPRASRRPAALTRAAGVRAFRLRGRLVWLTLPSPRPSLRRDPGDCPCFSLPWRAGLLVWAGACPRPKNGLQGGYPWGQKLLYLKWPFFVHMIFGGFSYLVRYEKGRLEQIFGVLQIPT